jgi:hypothetical protein
MGKAKQWRVTMMRCVLMTGKALAAALVLASAGPALGTIILPGGNTEGNGDFNLSPFAYGVSGSAYLSALLYVGDLGGTLQPADQVSGTALTYMPPNPSGLGTSVVDLAYTITNTSPSFSWSDLRFLIYLDPNGNNVSFTDLIEENWPAKSAGDPDKRQIGADALLNPIKPAMQSAGGVLDGANACVGACDTDFGFEWDRASLAPGESWTIDFRMVDDAALVIGGRYARATSSDGSGTLFAGNPQVPEPQAYAMLLASLGLLAVLRVRKI